MTTASNVSEQKWLHHGQIIYFNIYFNPLIVAAEGIKKLSTQKMLCVESIDYWVIINDNFVSLITLNIGMHQGDPLSRICLLYV